MKALNSYALRVCALRCAVQLSWTNLGWMGGRDKILLDSTFKLQPAYPHPCQHLRSATSPTVHRTRLFIVGNRRTLFPVAVYACPVTSATSRSVFISGLKTYIFSMFPRSGFCHFRHCNRSSIVLHISLYSSSHSRRTYGAVISSNHRLRGSASPVLTATGFVNGKGQFSSPTESTPLNRSPKICHR